MKLPHKITIYDKFEIAHNQYVYYRYVLSGVLYMSKIDSKVSSYGTVNSDVSLVQVPIVVESDAPMGYSSPIEWQNGDDKFRENHFTLRKGQLILKGDIVLDLSSGKPLDVSQVQNDYIDTFIIDKVVTADFGAKKLQHWRLTGR